jgi:hypothetical protein
LCNFSNITEKFEGIFKEDGQDVDEVIDFLMKDEMLSIIRQTFLNETEVQKISKLKANIENNTLGLTDKWLVLVNLNLF